MSISSLALTAKKVIDAAWLHGEAYDLSSQAAFALESAQLLQSPETVAEITRLRTALRDATEQIAGLESDLGGATARVAELETERHSTNEALSDAAEQLRANRDHIATLEANAGQTAGAYPPALPWARFMDDEDLSDFLDDLAAAAGAPGTFEGALAIVENTIAQWRVIGEAQHAHNTAPGPNAEDDVTPQVAKLRALLAGQAEQTGCA